MHTITSPDGTTIAYDRTGAGEPLVLVGGAFSYRRYPGQVKLAELLSARFTVYSYDRRGRGDSDDTAPYAVQREIEDLAAVIGAAGGAACVWGLSSGAVLALEAAAAGLPIRKLAVQEPPLGVDPADRRPPAGLRQHVSGLIDAGQRGQAVRYYMVDGMGAPAFVPALLHLIPGAWTTPRSSSPTRPGARCRPGSGPRSPCRHWSCAAQRKKAPASSGTAPPPSPPRSRTPASSSAAAWATPRSSRPRSSRPPSPTSSLARA